MTKRTRLLITAAHFAMAHENAPGWKKDADGKLELDGAGNPIYVNAGGVEASVKHDTITTLMQEARQHRETAERAIAINRKYEVDGKLLDPELAKKAIDTVGKIDAKTLIDAGKVDEVRAEMAKSYEGKIGELETKLGDSSKTISNMRIDGVFKGSEFIADRVAMPRDFFESAMRSHFKDEDGKITAYDRSGNPIYSKKNVGELASPDEALELLVEMHPQKDTILKAPPAGGSGSGGGGGVRGRGAVMKRGDFDALEPGEKAQAGAAMAKGELTIAD